MQTSTGEIDPKEEDVSDVDQDNAFSWSLGAGIVVSPRPYRGAEAGIIPIPSIEMQYKRWFFRGIRGGYSVIQSERFTANLFAQAQFKGLDPEDSPFLEGMEGRSRSMDAGMEFIYSGRPVGFQASFLTDALNRSNGQELSLQLVTGAPIPDRGVILFGIGPKWMSENRVDYYYGVRDSEATDARPAYAAPDVWNLDINLTGILTISSRWRVFVRMNREGFGSGIKDSPIVDKSSAYSIISSLNYRF